MNRDKFSPIDNCFTFFFFLLTKISMHRGQSWYEFYQQHCHEFDYCYRHDVMRPIIVKYEGNTYRYLPQASLKYKHFILIGREQEVPFNESIHW